APSSIIPMAMPGTLSQVPKWITNPLGPLTISWRELPALLPWFRYFRRACEPAQVERAARALRSLNRESVHAYQTLLASVGAPDLVKREGMLHVYRTEAGFNASAFARKLRTDNEAPVEVLDADEIRRRAPALAPEYRWGFFLPDNGNVTNPGRVVEVLAADFVRNSGVIEKVAANGFRFSNGIVSHLITTAGEIDVENVVIAAGVSSKRLAAHLGSRIPIAPERGYHIQVPNPGVELSGPVTDGEGRFVATPMEGGLRFAGTSEFRRADAPPNWQRTDALATLGARMLPGVKVDGYSRWMGTRPSMPDSLAVIGRAPGYRNAYFAFGHGHWGLMAAPATAQAMSDLLAKRAPRIDLTPFRPERFG
ncbi:MAG TPA: FAD-dependent oxidoreductase, partial [Burkholderiales bacterium]|nr:FAD-dependent oxidoreductase [Burkholderiales bacterium]